MRLDESVRQFRAPLFEQVDLRQEALNLVAFNENFRSWKDVTFPVPIQPLVDSAVLVETFERGTTISAYMNSDDEELRRAIAETGCRVLLKMMLADNFVHADLHPGNILVRLPEEEVEPSRRPFWALWGRTRRPTVVLLDCGMTVSLTDRNKYNLLSFFEARAPPSAARCLCSKSLPGATPRFACPAAATPLPRSITHRLVSSPPAPGHHKGGRPQRRGDDPLL